MMGYSFLTVLASAWLVSAGAHVIERRQIVPNLVLCVDTEAPLADQSNIYAKSPYFGFSDYLSNTRCELTLRSSAEPLKVNVQFDAFDLELESRACSYDSLCVGGVDFCGNWPVNQRFTYILPPYRNFTIAFRTDESNTARGFQVNIHAERYDYQPTNVTSGGVGSSSGGVQIELISFNSSYLDTYQDRCAGPAHVRFWDYQTSPSYTVTDIWLSPGTPRYPPTSSRYSQASPSYSRTDPWYHETSPGYYQPTTQLDTNPILYFLYEAQAALSRGNFNRERARDDLFRAYDASGVREVSYKK